MMDAKYLVNSSGHGWDALSKTGYTHLHYWVGFPNQEAPYFCYDLSVCGAGEKNVLLLLKQHRGQGKPD